jgi:hypothetical protein
MDLVFPGGLVLMVLLSAIITAQVAGDGRSDWLKGLQLLAVYVIFGLTFFFLPGGPAHPETNAKLTRAGATTCIQTLARGGHRHGGRYGPMAMTLGA